MVEEYLYGITLQGENSSEVWDPEHKNEDSDGGLQNIGTDQKLIIKMALLGPDAKQGELNVLSVEAMGLQGTIKTPIALLEMGKTSQIILDLSFPDPPVTFTLVKGNGPVHIVGHNLLGVSDDDFELSGEHIEEIEYGNCDLDEENIDEEDDEKEDDEEDEEEEPKKKNAKLNQPKYKQANKNKKK